MSSPWAWGAGGPGRTGLSRAALTTLPDIEIRSTPRLAARGSYLACHTAERPAAPFWRSGMRISPLQKGAVRCRVGAHSRTAPHPWWLLGRQVPRVRPPGEVGYSKILRKQIERLSDRPAHQSPPWSAPPQGHERFDTRVVVYLSFTSVNSLLYADYWQLTLPSCSTIIAHWIGKTICSLSSRMTESEGCAQHG